MQTTFDTKVLFYIIADFYIKTTKHLMRRTFKQIKDSLSSFQTNPFPYLPPDIGPTKVNKMPITVSF